MIKPTIHLNGTGREELHARYREAYRRVDDAMAALQNCSPHPRDYYPQGEGVFEAARAEHMERAAHLWGVRSQLHKLVLHCMKED